MHPMGSNASYTFITIIPISLLIFALLLLVVKWEEVEESGQVVWELWGSWDCQQPPQTEALPQVLRNHWGPRGFENILICCCNYILINTSLLLLINTIYLQKDLYNVCQFIYIAVSSDFSYNFEKWYSHTYITSSRSFFYQNMSLKLYLIPTKAVAATIEGKMSKPLKKLMKKLVSEETQSTLAVAEAKLGSLIKVGVFWII